MVRSNSWYIKFHETRQTKRKNGDENETKKRGRLEGVASMLVTEWSTGILIHPIAYRRGIPRLFDEKRWKKARRCKYSDRARRAVSTNDSHELCQLRSGSSFPYYCESRFHRGSFYRSGHYRDRVTCSYSRIEQRICSNRATLDRSRRNLIYRIPRLRGARRFWCLIVYKLREFVRLERDFECRTLDDSLGNADNKVATFVDFN